MTLKKRLLISAMTFAGIGAAPAAAAEFINFETTAGGAQTFAGGAVGNDFSAFGASFTNAFYRQCGGGCPAPANGIFVSSNNFANPFTITFAGITNAFSFSNASNSSGTASAFGIGGNLLESIAISGFPSSFSFTSTGINSISFSSSAQLGVDNFAFGDVQGMSAVPEPAAWAMMLIGFGFVGGTMRAANRRKKFAVTYA